MNCDEYQELVDDAVDGTLAAADQSRLDVHMAGCAHCRVMFEDFLALRRAAHDLEPHVPPAHAWTRIVAAVDAERSRPRWGWAWQPLAVAAALLLVVGGTSWVVWRQISQMPEQTRTVAPAQAPADPELVQSVETELKLAEEHYQKAIAGLEQITKSESAELDPQVSAVLQKNLLVIDQAIGESRAALQTQPANDVAQQSLFEALRSKVSLLQDTVVLINEMRKGNQEGAARVASGLNQ